MDAAKRQTSISKILLIILTILLVLIIALIGMRKFTQFEYVENLPTGAPFQKTIFVYEWPGNIGVVYDDHNLIETIYGYDPIHTMVSVKDGVREIKFINDGAILKTEHDSVQIDLEDARYMGYMGIWTKCRRFSIDKDGIVNELCN